MVYKKRPHYTNESDGLYHKRTVDFVNQTIIEGIRNTVGAFQKLYCPYDYCRENATFLWYYLKMMGVEADIIKGKMYVTPFWRKFRPETICKSITIDHERVQLYRNEKYGISEYSMIDTCPFQAHDAVVKYVGNDMANEHMNILDYVLIQNRHEHLHYEPYGYVEPEEIDARMKLAIGYEGIRKTVPEIFQELAL